MMAPISRDPSIGHLQNGHAGGDFDPPPSTMAVQLINNISTVGRPSRAAEQDDLQTLMAEVSELENSAAEPHSLMEKVQHKHKLIYVFARAVLARLNEDDPFMNVQQLVGQASEALDIFMVTIKETPSVLKYRLKAGEYLPTRDGEPLWIWLFPKVLTLLGRRSCESLTEKIKDFFYISFQAVARSPQQWDLSSLFFSYLKECAAGLLEWLQRMSVVQNHARLHVELPPKELDYSLFLYEKDNLPTSWSQCTYKVSATTDGLAHIIHLLCMLVDVSMEAALSYDATPAFQNYLAWALDSISLTHELLKRRRENINLQLVESKPEESFLCAVHAMISSIKHYMSQAILRKSYVLLAILCADVLERTVNAAGDVTHTTVCSCLLMLSAACREDDHIRQLITTHLSNSVTASIGKEHWGGSLTNDFKKAANVFRQACKGPLHGEPILEELVSFQNVELNSEFRRLDLQAEIGQMVDVEDSRPFKRRKISDARKPLDGLVSDLYSLLGHQEASDLDGLGQVAEESYASLSDTDRSKVINYLGRIPCVAGGAQQPAAQWQNTTETLHCPVCEGGEISDAGATSDSRTQGILEESIRILEKLIQSPIFLESRRARVLAMLALRRYVTHTQLSSILDLQVSVLGMWCLKSLKSSVRELRVAAGRTLPLFLRGNISDKGVLQNNRVVALSWLRDFPEREHIHLQETCILAWGQVGRVLTDESSVFVLLGLVKYLGHANPVVSGVAFNEILNLAKSKNVTVRRMFSPFWSAIAFEAVKDLVARPQTTQYMADLLVISVNDFLLLTQAFSLPYLVLRQNVDVIKRISQARKDELDFRVCCDSTNLVAILALLLQQNVKDQEKYIMSLLGNVSDEFRNLDLAHLMKIESAYTAFHLLMAAGEADDSKKSRIHFALKTLAHRAPTAETSKRKGNQVGIFLEQHLLGLVAKFSDIINDHRGEYSMIERVRCIKAVEEMIRVAKSHARNARPHLCVCLQSAIAINELRSVAFLAWHAMLQNLEDEDVEAMLESTFSIIIQYWGSFSEEIQSQARQTLEYFLSDRTRLVRITITNLPSLSQIPALKDIDDQLKKFRTPTDTGNAFQIFSRRIRNENPSVVYQVLIELKAYLRVNQSFLQASAVSEQPDVVVGRLVRSILDTCVKFNDSHRNIAQLSAECIGLVGCLDPNRVDSVREQREMIVVGNFCDNDGSETTDFVLFILHEVIVPAFLSTTDTSLQGFFSYVMQSLLEACEFKSVCGPIGRAGARDSNPLYMKWQSLPASVQDTLTPFLSSKFTIKDMEKPKYDHPFFRPNNIRSQRLYHSWLRTFVLDLLQKPHTRNATAIFTPLTRAIRIKDTSVAIFLLPYLVLHVILEGSDQDRKEIGEELLCVLEYESPPETQSVRREDVKLCVEAVFGVLDYLSRWILAKQVQVNQTRGQEATEPYIKLIKSVIDVIPAEIMSQRATECRSYSRALFYWEQHIRHTRDTRMEMEKQAQTKTNEIKVVEKEDANSKDTALLEHLQEIYTQIDEPDGIEGISAHLHVLDIEQQILGHRKAGRWTAAQSWYEIKLAEDPTDLDVQVNLLTCLKESGQHDVLLNYVEGMYTATPTASRLLPFATEASWATGRWKALEKYANLTPNEFGDEFNLRLGQALLALHKDKVNTDTFKSIITSIREHIACSLSTPMTSSLSTFHDAMLKLHVLTELEMIAGTDTDIEVDRTHILASLNRRLEVIGAYLNDKQYLLGIRRAAMKLSNLNFTEDEIAESWLTSARLARKGNAIHQSFNAVLHAAQLGDESAKIENARLLWKEGHHRKAIQNLQGAIDSNAFTSHNKSVQHTRSFTVVDAADQQNLLTARAHLMLAKWMDAAGQTHSTALRTQYQLAARTHTSWEKGHYYLGRHYNKLLESEKALPAEQQKESYLSGEAAKLVIENYLRSLNHGTKYLYQTLPRVLTLWLDLGSQISQPLDTKYGNSKEFVTRINGLRKQHLEQLHSRFAKYIAKMPAYMFYTALPQILSRVSHPNQDVYKYLHQIILKVVSAYPQHSLWNLLAVCTSNQPDRKNRGAAILQALQSNKKSDTGGSSIRSLIKDGSRLTEQLLYACTAGEFQGNRTSWVSLSKDLGFNHKACTPSQMVVPFESVLMATLPTLTDTVKTHKAFSRDVVTIASFQEEVMVLSSLQKPRKLTARGSDGRSYGLMCKPKDDLRKDQRLMEFNSMINRALKRDAEASRRQLYIKTYAVTPLNEECGLIEWVDGLKTLRDILLNLYKAMGLSPNYREIEAYCEHALKADSNMPFFTEKVLGRFPPIFHKWFVQQFPEPSAWFAARLRYTRSCAVMSMVGTILGLGDRHGENILFEEGNGGTFHVDFNCLFDKGLTFMKPERVPFRLTHNMVDAMGLYGYEGPFRKSSELTIKLLRQHEETLMTILEAFVYDPTLDLLAKKGEKKKKAGDVPQTAQGVLDSIQRKVKGHLPGETVPLGVEGQVDELIQQATDLKFLAGMYIGWCSFL